MNTKEDLLNMTPEQVLDKAIEYAEESEQEKLQRHGENDEPEQVDNGQQHYEDMQSQYAS